MSGYQDTDFTSFWNHYSLVQKWVKFSETARQRSYEDNEANEEVLVEMKGNEEEEEELSPEMIAFYKTTIEHREERERKRKHEEEEKRKERQAKGGTWLNDNDDEYILASEGIHGVQKQTVDSPSINLELEEYRAQKRLMYGTAAEKIIAMELAMNFKFNEHITHYNPSLWPNIPLRF